MQQNELEGKVQMQEINMYKYLKPWSYGLQPKMH